MDRLWAPWRMEYIEKIDREEGCFICDAFTGKDDRKNLVLYRGREAFILMNRYPYNSGHLMIVPNEHTPDILALTETCRSEVMSLCGRSMAVLGEGMGSQGFNCGMNIGRVAGAGTRDHFHMHVVPRWPGDVNFLPVLGGTKSMPEYLEETYDRLMRAFEKVSSKIVMKSGREK